jgi:hypothetical protein
MNVSAVSTLGSSLVLPAVATTRAYPVAPAASSTLATPQVAGSGSRARAATSARYTTRGLGIEDFSALVAEAEVRARTIELFGNGSDGSRVASSSSWVGLDDEAGLGDWLSSDSQSTSAFASTETEANSSGAFGSSLLSDPADENGDGFVSSREELSYGRTHALESALFAGDEDL